MNATTGIKRPEADADGVFPERCTYLSDTGPALKASQIGLVPGAEVPLMPLSLPQGLRGHAREQVAERQLRDMLVGGRDLVEIRPFYAPGQSHGWTRALVADRAQLDEWRQRAGPACKAVLPDYLTLPAAEQVWTVVPTGGMVLARLGPQDGFSAAPALAVLLLREALSAAEPRPKAVFGPVELLPELETLFADYDLLVAPSEEALCELGLAVPRALAHGELGFDLRRDPRAARAKLRRSVLPWRWPLLVGLIAAGLWAGAQMLAMRGLEEQTAQIRAATLETVRAEFVPAGPVLDIRTQVARALAEARVAATGAGEAVAPLDLLGLAADVMTHQNAQPDYIDYTAANGLSALVRVENFAAADALASALSDAGLTVRVVESRVSDGDDGVRTELRISASAPGEVEQ